MAVNKKLLSVVVVSLLLMGCSGKKKVGDIEPLTPPGDIEAAITATSEKEGGDSAASDITGEKPGEPGAHELTPEQQQQYLLLLMMSE